MQHRVICVICKTYSFKSSFVNIIFHLLKYCTFEKLLYAFFISFVKSFEASLTFPLYILRGHRLYFPLTLNFILENSIDPDEMLHCAA